MARSTRGPWERAWPLPRLDRPLPGSAGSLAADPLDREHPDADHDEKPTTAGQQVIAIDTNMAAAQGNPVGIMHGSKRATVTARRRPP